MTALQGNLTDFGIPDILQLIGNQQKTGILHVEGQGPLAEVQVYFRGGKVIRCDVTRRDRRDALGDLLVGAGAITREQLAAALKEQKKTLRPLGDLLVEQEAITPEALRSFVELLTRETVYEIFEWKQGTYRFEGKAPGFAKAVVEPMTAESLLMEGFRRLDEWPLVRARINNYETVYRPLRQVEDLETEADALDRILDDAFSETVDPGAVAQRSDRRRGAASGTAARLGRKERRVLRLVDGKADVYTLIARSRLGEFETCKALLTLLNDGYIAPVKARPPKAARGSGAWRRGWLPVVGRVALNVAFLGVLVLIVLFIPRSRAQLDENARQVARETVSRLRANRILAASAALEVYRIETDTYPGSLDALAERGLLDPDVLALPGQEPLDYLSIGSDYDLR